MGRYKHRVVCNIPRVTSPGGDWLRALFGCGPGRMQFGFDFSSLEARILGHFVMPFTNGEALAASMVAEKPNDCFDMDSYLLTKTGWIHSSQLTMSTDIVQWDMNTKTFSLSKPTRIIRRKHKGEMITVVGDRLDIKVTPNHIITIYNRDSNQYIKMEAKELKDYIKDNPNSFVPANGNSSFVLDGYDINLTTVDKGNTIIYRSTDLDTITRIATNERLHGSSALIIEKDFEGTKVYQTAISEEPLNVDGFKLIYDEISTTTVDEEVWCLTVPTNHVMIKRNNSIYITGQCHTINAINLWGDANKRPDAKSFSYAVMYGAQPSKLARMLRIPLEEAERLFEAYWDSVPALRELKDRVEAFWKKTGKQYITGIDGRKLYVRSQHSLINLLFQSSGALCVKYVLVGVCRRLEELNMLGDLLVDNEEDIKTKVYQMIAYHKLKTLWY